MFVFFFKQKTAYEMRISDWSSDVCSSDLLSPRVDGGRPHRALLGHLPGDGRDRLAVDAPIGLVDRPRMAGTGGDRPRHRADADRHRPPDAPPPPPDARRIGPIDLQPMSACKWRLDRKSTRLNSSP